MANLEMRIETKESTTAKLADKLGFDQASVFDLVDRSKYADDESFGRRCQGRYGTKQPGVSGGVASAESTIPGEAGAGAAGETRSSVQGNPF